MYANSFIARCSDECKNSFDLKAGESFECCEGDLCNQPNYRYTWTPTPTTTETTRRLAAVGNNNNKSTHLNTSKLMLLILAGFTLLLVK